MLSISPIRTAEAAKTYFENSIAEYYQQDGELAAQSGWFGHGAAALGLTGEVDLQRFEQLLGGTVAGTQLGRTRDGKCEHQSGWDLTFSAPKSVSVLALVAGDERLTTAHRNAVNKAMVVLEQEFTKTRIRVSRTETLEVATGSLVAAQFHHALSRAQDPQLHTHCVVANATQREDGKWRSLHSINFFDHKMLVGQVFRSELALEVQKLGYELDIDHRTGLFEIKSVPNKALECFSKRRAAIEAAAWATNAKSMERAAIATRQKKAHQSPEVLNAQWLDSCKEIGFTPTKPLAPTKNQSEVQLAPSWAETVLQQAIVRLADREAVFSQKQLCAMAMRIGLGNVGYAAIRHALQECIAERHLVPSSLVLKGRLAVSYTTPSALRRERYVLDLLEQGRGEKTKISHQWKVDRHIRDSGLTIGQRDAISLIVTSKDQFVGVQGYAGVGKTTMLRQLKPIIEASGYQLRAFAPTHAATEALKTETNIQSRTLASFLLTMEQKQQSGKLSDSTKEVWVVDEASLVGAKDMARLLTLARAAKSRVVLLGDKAQLGAVSWGKPFQLLQNHGMSCVLMREIQRQKNPNLKQAVQFAIGAGKSIVKKAHSDPLILAQQRESLAKQQIEHSLGAISKNVLEIGDQCARRQAMVAHYAGISAKERSETLVIIPDNQTRQELMPQIRQVALQGLDVSEAISASVLLSVDCQNHSRAQSYAIGEVVEFHKTYRKLGIKSGGRFQVADINGKKNEITLISFEEQVVGKSAIVWNPAKVAGNSNRAVSVFRSQRKDFVVGEKIVFSKTDKEIGIKNGDVGEIVGMVAVDKKITAKLEDGKLISFSCDKLKQFDYAYATTAYKAQGKTVDNVLFLAESYRENLITQKSFYVALSRARHGVKIFTDSAEKLTKALSHRDGNKTSAIEQTEMHEKLEDLALKNTQKTSVPFPKGIDLAN